MLGNNIFSLQKSILKTVTSAPRKSKSTSRKSQDRTNEHHKHSSPTALLSTSKNLFGIEPSKTPAPASAPSPSNGLLVAGLFNTQAKTPAPAPASSRGLLVSGLFNTEARPSSNNTSPPAADLFGFGTVTNATAEQNNTNGSKVQSKPQTAAAAATEDYFGGVFKNIGSGDTNAMGSGASSLFRSVAKGKTTLTETKMDANTASTGNNTGKTTLNDKPSNGSLISFTNMFNLTDSSSSDIGITSTERTGAKDAAKNPLEASDIFKITPASAASANDGDFEFVTPAVKNADDGAGTSGKQKANQAPINMDTIFNNLGPNLTGSMENITNKNNHNISKNQEVESTVTSLEDEKSKRIIEDNETHHTQALHNDPLNMRLLVPSSKTHITATPANCAASIAKSVFENGSRSGHSLQSYPSTATHFASTVSNAIAVAMTSCGNFTAASDPAVLAAVTRMKRRRSASFAPHQHRRNVQIRPHVEEETVGHYSPYHHEGFAKMDRLKNSQSSTRGKVVQQRKKTRLINSNTSKIHIHHGTKCDSSELGQAQMMSPLLLRDKVAALRNAMRPRLTQSHSVNLEDESHVEKDIKECDEYVRRLRLAIPGLPLQKSFDSYDNVQLQITSSPWPDAKKGKDNHGFDGSSVMPYVSNATFKTSNIKKAEPAKVCKDFLYTGLSLSHPDIGSVTWLEPVSLRNPKTGNLVNLKDVVKMGIDPVTLRPFIAIFWNPNILPTPPKGEWLNKRVRISLKGQFMYQKGQRLNAKGRAIVKEQVRAFVRQEGGIQRTLSFNWRWGKISFELPFVSHRVDSKNSGFLRKENRQRKSRHKTAQVLEKGAQFLW